MIFDADETDREGETHKKFHYFTGGKSYEYRDWTDPTQRGIVSSQLQGASGGGSGTALRGAVSHDIYGNGMEIRRSVGGGDDFSRNSCSNALNLNLKKC